MPSEARTVGLFNTLVLLSVMIMFSSAPGSVVEKSAEEMWPSWLSATAVLPVVVGVVVVVVGERVVVVPVVVVVVPVVPVVVVTGFVGENANGTVSPVFPLELTILAAR